MFLLACLCLCVYVCILDKLWKNKWNAFSIAFICEITEIVEEGHQKTFGNCCDGSVQSPDQISYSRKPDLDFVSVRFGFEFAFIGWVILCVFSFCLVFGGIGQQTYAKKLIRIESKTG